jgi:mono/diheme cytochrome c family protein
MCQLEQLCLIASLTLAMAVTTGSAGFVQNAAGGTSSVSGRDQYLNSCAACHGSRGRGNGAVRIFLKDSPSDLTALARNNHGVFPEKQIKAIIDGTKEVGPHGTREMPVWGREFLNQGSSPEQAQARISALVGYLRSIQEK